MRQLFFALLIGASVLAPAQSLHFTKSGCVPYQEIARAFCGKILEPRVDILRSKRAWDEFYSAENGFFGGPVVTSAIQPDFCKEQVIAINFGNVGALGITPSITSVKSLDPDTWEVRVDARKAIDTPSDGVNIASPYVAVRTPLGPDNFKIVFITNSGEETLDLRSSYYTFPKDWWARPRSGHDRDRTDR